MSRICLLAQSGIPRVGEGQRLSLQLLIAGQNARMSKSNEYRLRAEECLQKANLANCDADKRTWLSLFNGWLLLSNLRQTTEQRLAKSRPKLQIVR